MGQLRKMSPAGDTVIAEWDVTDEQSVEDVRREFDQIVTHDRWIAYALDTTATRGTKEVGEGPIREFDPNVETYLLTPPMVGG